ncbi:putative FAD-linked oxidoreductase [compost metagenome]
MLPNEYAKNVGEASKIVYEITAGLDGSISAEHGIGISLRDKLPLFKDPAEMQLMKDIKNLLDPKGIMNPGKLICGL